MKKTIIFLTFLFSVHVLLAQGFLDLVDMGGHVDYVRLPATNLFDEVEVIGENSLNYRGVLEQGLVLSPRDEDIQNILTSEATRVKMNVPTTEGNMELWLVPSPSVGGNLPMFAASRRDVPIQEYNGKWYWGVVKDSPGSFVSVSVGEHEVMAFISFPDRDVTLAKLGGSENYVVYRNSDLLVANELGCAVDEELHLRGELRNEIQGGARDANNCVNQYVEANHNIFLDKGSITATSDYILGLFNQVGILYANENVMFSVSELLVWNVPSPYPGPSSSNFLVQFREEHNGVFNGDFAHLVGYGGGGGVAYLLGSACGSKAWRSAYSGIGSTYQNVPTYSWSVMVVAHELGHNLGAYHTHDCFWNGPGNPAIDGCGPAAGYSDGCDGPIPANGGTVMSYCHLLGGVGINLANGFGLQPGDLIRDRVHNAACLGDCLPFANCSPGLEANILPDCDESEIEISLVITNADNPENYDVSVTVNGGTPVQVLTNQPAGTYVLGPFDAADIIDVVATVVGSSNCQSDLIGVSANGNDGLFGCTNPDACNYNPNAVCDDGTCEVGELITVTFSTDCWGGESSWQITDSQDEVVFSVAQGDYASFQTYQTNFCLQPGCYTFTVSDSFGDGLNGSASGCQIDGSYSITNSEDEILVQMGDPNFGFEISHPFCLSEEPECTELPVLSSVSQSMLPCVGGNSITLTGVNFCDVNNVTINGVNAPISSISPTEIVVMVPQGSGTNLNLLVNAVLGSSNALQVSYEAPVLISVAPSAIPCAGGTSLTLTGTNFCDATSVSIGGQSVTISSITPTEIEVVSLAGSGTDLDVVVTTPSGGSNAVQVSYEAPNLTFVAPTSIPCTGNITMTLVGTNFCNATSVTIGGVNAPIVSVDPTMIIATALPGTGSGLPVIVTSPSGVSNSQMVSYSPPVLNSVAPGSIPCEGGVSLTLSGNNFCSASSVTIDGVSVSINSVTPTEIVVTASSGSGTNLDVVVTTPSGVSNAVAVSYAAPVLSSVVPSNIPCEGGTMLTLSGSNFCDATAVTIGGVAASINSITPTQIEVTSPPGSGVDLDVTVSTPSGTSNAVQISYEAPGLILVAPAVIPCEGNSTITLIGNNLCDATSVTIGGVNALIVSVAPTEIVASTPPGTGNAMGVVVTTPSGVSNTILVNYAPPVITSVNPVDIPCEGGVPMTLEGSDFCGATSVTIGGVSAAITSVTPTQIIVTAPSGNGVDLSVLVQTPSGTSNAMLASYLPCDVECDLDYTYTSTGATLGYANGSATITVTGGQPAYSYQWNDPFMQTGPTLFGVFPGVYLCTVTDANDCVETFEVFIGFASDVPTTQVHPNFCNTGGYALGDFVQASSVQSATAYRWQFSVGSTFLPEYTRNASNPWIRLSWIDGIDLDVTYNVRVKARVNGEWGEYGDVCTITTSSEVPQTELRPEYHETNGGGNPYVMCDLMIAFGVSGATDYRWRLDPDSDPNNGNEMYYTRGSGNPSVRLSWIEGVQPMQTYQVAVEAAIGDVWSGFGNVHNITLGSPAITEVRSNHCGVTYASSNTVIAAQSVCTADYYEFELANTSTGITSMATRPNAAVLLSSNDVSPALTPGMYNARVRVQQSGVLGSWGLLCTFTIASPGQESPMPEEQQATLQPETSVTLYPNPLSGTVIWLEAEELPDNQQHAIVQLMDVYGKVLHSATLNYEGSRHTEAIELGRSLASGVYILQITVDGKWIAAERLVVQ